LFGLFPQWFRTDAQDVQRFASEWPEWPGQTPTT